MPTPMFPFGAVPLDAQVPSERTSSWKVRDRYMGAYDRYKDCWPNSVIYAVLEAARDVLDNSANDAKVISLLNKLG